MKIKNMMTIREFARLAGVTVRTLHFYDQKELLRPAQREENGYRLYRQEDLLRLQQILTLKMLGLSLAEIAHIFKDSKFDLQYSLEMQMAAIGERIQTLQNVTWGLRYTLERVKSRGAKDLEWPIIAEIIKGVNKEGQNDWAKQFYSPQVWQKLQARASQISPEQIAQYTKDWEELINDFKQRMDHSPDDLQVQQSLAARMDALLNLFTQGDSKVTAGLEKMYANSGEGLPKEYRGFYDPVVQEFMSKALSIFQKNK
jgi:DNA-binding transcriptional MerR regulator